MCSQQNMNTVLCLCQRIAVHSSSFLTPAEFAEIRYHLRKDARTVFKTSRILIGERMFPRAIGCKHVTSWVLKTG